MKHLMLFGSSRICQQLGNYAKAYRVLRVVVTWCVAG